MLGLLIAIVVLQSISLLCQLSIAGDIAEIRKRIESNLPNWNQLNQ